MSSTKTGRLPSIMRRFVQRSPTSPGDGQLEQVGQQRLLVVDVEDDVADHAPHRGRRGAAPRSARRWSGLGVVEVDDEADAPAATPTRRSRPGRTSAFIRFT